MITHILCSSGPGRAGRNEEGGGEPEGGEGGSSQEAGHPRVSQRAAHRHEGQKRDNPLVLMMLSSFFFFLDGSGPMD
jgi:hypothetical protein